MPLLRTSSTIMNSVGDSGSLCLSPWPLVKKFDEAPSINNEVGLCFIKVAINSIHFMQNLNLSKTLKMNC